MVSIGFDGIEFFFELVMDKYFKRKSMDDLPPLTLKNENNNKVPSISKKSRGEVNLVDLPADPGVRSPISSYHSND